MKVPVRWTARRLGGIGLMAVLLAQIGVAQRSMTVSLADALTYYELGEHDAVERALAVARGGDPFTIVPMLEKDASVWIDADGPERAARRRMVAAAFALEAGYAGLRLAVDNHDAARRVGLRDVAPSGPAFPSRSASGIWRRSRCSKRAMNQGCRANQRPLS